jgi:hypothetical protein
MPQKTSLSSYVPDDAKITVSSLEFLHSDAGASLLAAVAELLAANSSPTVSEFAAFRKNHPADVVHAAFAVARAQHHGISPDGKFPALPFIWAIPEALEQSTDAVVAKHKASRFAEAAVTEIVDLCAGIGGDTMALANVAPVTAVDLSAPRVLCLRWNIEIAAPRFPVQAIKGDVRAILPSLPATAAFHIDPARRSAGHRSASYEDLMPGPEILAEVIAHFTGGAIKLSPAVDFDTLPPGHLELISHNRTVVQAVLWTGVLAARFPPNTRIATVVRQGQPPLTFTAEQQPVSVPTADDSSPPYFYETDGAFTRAGLSGPLAASLHLQPVTTDGGYLSGQTLLHHPALTPFSTLLTVRYSDDRVAAALSQVGGEPGPVEVKTRGGLPGIDTDRLQKLWTKKTPVRRTVLIYRRGGEILATLAARIPPAA